MEEWLDLRTRCPWPEQQRYEILRSVVLFGHSPAERALEPVCKAENGLVSG